MKIWLTYPHGDGGPEEIDTIGEPSDGCIRWKGQIGTATACHWYREGETWHRSLAEAQAAVRRHRLARIAKASAEIARVTKLLEATPEARDDQG